jgi:phosphoglycolate phosphatase
MKTPVDLIIFDFDGTLADSIPGAVAAIQSMLKTLNYPAKSVEEINSHVGFGEEPLVSGSIGSNDPQKVKEAMGVYFDRYQKEHINKIQLYPHVKETLEHFKDKKMVILSNKKQGFIKVILKNHGIDKYFSEVLGGDTAPCLKPDPCEVLNILSRHKVEKGRALFVGDMTVDIETGKNAGILTCGVTYGFDGRGKLEAAKPDMLIDKLLALIELIA